MKNFTTIGYRALLAAAITITLGAVQQVAAQATTPGSGGPTPTTPPPTAVPIDGGAGLLLAGGVAYGLRRLRQRRQK